MVPGRQWLGRCRKRYRIWRRRKDLLSAAKFTTTLATEKAHWHLAAYKAKAEIEWDFKFLTPLDKTLKDDLLLLVLSYPLLGLFVPGLRQPIMDGFKFLSSIDPSAPSLFLYGWAAIFTATTGVSITKGFLAPGRVSKIIQAMGSQQDDVPQEAVGAAQDAVSESPSTSDKAQETP